jgi:hypothetical protein
MGHPVTPALLASRHRNALPVRLLLVSAVSNQAQHSAYCHQGLDAGHAQLGGFFHQPIHTLIGGHSDGQVDCHGGFAFDGLMADDLHFHITSPHAQHRRVELASHKTAAIKQSQGGTGLLPQHLHVAGSRVGQYQRLACLHGLRTVDSGHCY